MLMDCAQQRGSESGIGANAAICCTATRKSSVPRCNGADVLRPTASSSSFAGKVDSACLSKPSIRRCIACRALLRVNALLQQSVDECIFNEVVRLELAFSYGTAQNNIKLHSKPVYFTFATLGKVVHFIACSILLHMPVGNDCRCIRFLVRTIKHKKSACTSVKRRGVGDKI